MKQQHVNQLNLEEVFEKSVLHCEHLKKRLPFIYLFIYLFIYDYYYPQRKNDSNKLKNIQTSALNVSPPAKDSS